MIGQLDKLSRRALLKGAGAGVGAGLLSCAGIGRADPAPAPVPHDVLTRKLPQSGEVLPAIGLGTFMTFDVLPGQGRQQLQHVLRDFISAGGRVIDTSPLYGTSEINAGDFLSALGANDQAFISNKTWSTGDYLWDESHAARSFEQSRQRLWRERIDLVQCHSLVNVEVVLPLLNAWKREGRIRHVGITHHDPAYFDILAHWIERGEIDCVQVHYSIHTTEAEKRVLPAAADNGVAVFINMPLEKARLHKLVESQPLPDFARELGIGTWTQYFLKWILAHPTVTAILPATSNPDHLKENMAALRGPLPDPDLRRRMREHLAALPGFDSLGTQPWYPDKRYPGLVARGQQAIRERTQ